MTHSDPFYSSKRCIGRAKTHIRDLDRKIGFFLQQEPCAVVVETDADGVDQLHKLKLTKSLPDVMEDIASDAIAQLRASLDQATYATVAAGGKPDAKNTYFPIADDVSKLENVIKGWCKDIPKEIVDVMRTFKPYKGGNNLLWALNRICNINKHKLLVPIGFAVGAVRYRNMTISGPASIPSPRWDRSKNEMIFARIGPKGQIQYKVDFSVNVAFDEIEIVGGQPAVPILKQMASMVDGIIGTIEAEALRIGLLK